ncbi:MAG: alcohol dehydrogenase catalytic domain-containing protein [Anaerolineales bacterium]|nr:alcohol dehydrogenase catalytic domain-containing protein [Anaerolineales bacterium]
MKVLRLHGPKDLRLHNEQEPIPGPGGRLVRVSAVGICGSDLHWFDEAGIGDSQLEKPLVIGHEFGGVITEGPNQGQRVAVDPAIACHACEFCQQGNPNLCEHLRFCGHGEEDGALREYIAWPEECLHPLPDALSDTDGAMLEPLGVALHAVDLAHLQVGMSVGVFGCGPIGLLILQLARLSGALNLIATDVLPHRLEAARALGAQHAIRAEETQELRKASKSRGLDVTFEAAGENDAIETAMATAKPGGRVILVGIPADDRTSFSASIARRKGLTIKLVRRMKFTYPRAIRLVESGQVDVRSLVTHRFPLEQSMQAFATAQRREGLKVVIIP